MIFYLKVAPYINCFALVLLLVGYGLRYLKRKETSSLFLSVAAFGMLASFAFKNLYLYDNSTSDDSYQVLIKFDLFWGFLLTTLFALSGAFALKEVLSRSSET